MKRTISIRGDDGDDAGHEQKRAKQEEQQDEGDGDDVELGIQEFECVVCFGE